MSGTVMTEQAGKSGRLLINSLHTPPAILV